MQKIDNQDAVTLVRWSYPRLWIISLDQDSIPSSICGSC